MKRVFWGCALWLSVCVAPTVSAENRWAVVEPPKTHTEAWLQMQREGRMAAQQGQQLTPAERELVMERWLGSFKHEIPEFFEQDVAGEIER